MALNRQEDNARWTVRANKMNIQRALRGGSNERATHFAGTKGAAKLKKIRVYLSQEWFPQEEGQRPFRKLYKKGVDDKRTKDDYDRDWTPLELDRLNSYFLFSLGDFKEGLCFAMKREHMHKFDYTQDTFMFEILTPNLQVKPFFDLEMDGLMQSTNIQQECHDRLYLFLDWITIKLEGHTRITLEREDLYVTCANRPSGDSFKLSYHVLIQRKLFFASILDHNLFVKKLWADFQHYVGTDECAEEDKQLYENTIWGDSKFIIDDGIYTKNRLFKMPYQSKKDELNSRQMPFLGDDTGVDSMLVGLYSGTGDRQMINVEALRVPVEKLHASGQRIRVKRGTAAAGGEPAVAYNPAEEIFEGVMLRDRKGLTDHQLISFPRWKMFLHLIPNSTKVGQEVWLRVGMALFKCGASFEDWDEWSQLDTRHVIESAEVAGAEKNNRARFESFGSRAEGEPVYGLPFLRRLAKKNCAARATKLKPSVFRSEALLLDDYMTPDTSDITIVTETARYLCTDEDAGNLERPEKHFLLDAPMGKGKTSAIRRLLQQVDDAQQPKYKSVLMLSVRISFARYITGNDFAGLGLKCYTDEEEGGIFEERLVCSLESLGRVKTPEFDVVVLDECESVLKQFTSDTMRGNHTPIFSKLCKLISSAKKVIWADAFIMSRTTDYVRCFQESMVMIQNRTPVARKRTLVEYGDPDTLRYKINELVKKGEKLYVCSATKKAADDVVRGLRDKYKEDEDPQVARLFEEKLCYGPQLEFQYKEKLLYYSADTPGQDDKRSMQNIVSSWGRAEMVVTTPKITVGASYDENPSTFDATVIFFAPTCTMRDMLQCHMRVRHLKQDIVYYSKPSPQRMAAMKWKNPQVIYDSFEYFMAAERAKNEESIKDRLDLLEAEAKKINLRGSGVHPNQLSILRSIEYVKGMYNNPIYSPPKFRHLQRIIWHNLREDALSFMHHSAMVEMYLVDKLGYEKREIVKTAGGKKKKGDEEEEEDDEERVAAASVFVPDYGYDAIRMPDQARLDELKRLKRQGELTEVNHREEDKFFFEHYIDVENLKDVPGAVNHFFNMWMNKHTRLWITNAHKELFSSQVERLMSDALASGYGYELVTFKDVAVEAIEKLNRILGLGNSFQLFDNKTRFERTPELEKELKSYFTEAVSGQPRVQILYSAFRNRRTDAGPNVVYADKPTFRGKTDAGSWSWNSSLKALERIYRSWTGTVIEADESTGVNKANHTHYHVRPYLFYQAPEAVEVSRFTGTRVENIKTTTRLVHPQVAIVLRDHAVERMGCAWSLEEMARLEREFDRVREVREVVVNGDGTFGQRVVRTFTDEEVYGTIDEEEAAALLVKHPETGAWVRADKLDLEDEESEDDESEDEESETTEDEDEDDEEDVEDEHGRKLHTNADGDLVYLCAGCAFKNKNVCFCEEELESEPEPAPPAAPRSFLESLAALAVEPSRPRVKRTIVPYDADGNLMTPK